MVFTEKYIAVRELYLYRRVGIFATPSERRDKFVVEWTWSFEVVFVKDVYSAFSVTPTVQNTESYSVDEHGQASAVA
mgnify:CR=1 FL=1